MPTDNRAVFDCVRPWLDSDGFNRPGRIDALNAACDRFRANPANGIIFEEVRPWLDRRGFTADRITALNAACDALRAPANVSAIAQGAADAGAVLGGLGDALAAPAPEPAGDDRYLRLFQHLASPQAKPETVRAMARSFAQHAPAYGQDKSKARIADFVAQISNETGGFLRFEEDLRYRAQTMLRQWPSHFTAQTAAASVGKPVEIASRAYGGRMGNAPYPSRDGYDYRGRGALQLTGRSAYRLMGQRLNLPLEQQPDMAADPAVSVLIALEFYKANNVNAAIDAGDTRRARRITNGGSIGLDEVNRRRAKALEVL